MKAALSCLVSVLIARSSSRRDDNGGSAGGSDGDDQGGDKMDIDTFQAAYGAIIL